MKKVIFISIYLILSAICIGQNKIDLSALISQIKNINDPNNALKAAQNVKELAIQQQDSSILGQTNLEFGNIYFFQEIDDSSFFYYQNALNIFIDLRDTNYIASTLNNLSALKYESYQYFESINYAKEAIKYLTQKQIKNPETLAAIYNNIANSYENLSQIDSAIYYNNLAVNILQPPTSYIDSLYLADTYLGLGNRWGTKEDYFKSTSFYKKAQNLYSQFGELEKEALCNENLAINAMEQDSFDLSNQYFIQAQAQFSKLNDTSSLSNLYFNWTLLNIKTNNISNAKKYIQLAKDYAKEETKDFKYLVEITSDEIIARAENIKLWKTILFLIGVCFVLLSILLFHLWSKRKKELDKELQLTKMEREALATEKELITTKENLIHQQELNAKKEREGIEVRKELLEHQERLIASEKEALETRKKLTSERDKFNRIKHSKVKNQTIIIKNIIEAIKNNTDNENLSKAKINVDYLVHITEKSWDEIEQLNKFNKPKKLKAFAEDMLWKAKMLSLLEVELISEFDDIGDLLLKSDVQTIADEIIGNAFINICKHAECKNPQLIFSADDRGLIIEIIDDGKGFDMEKIRVGAQGLKDMETAAKSIGGTVKITSKINVGTQIKIILPTPFHE